MDGSGKEETNMRSVRQSVYRYCLVGCLVFVCDFMWLATHYDFLHVCGGTSENSDLQFM